MNKKRIGILGSTGSIGRSTLEIVRRFPDRFEVVSLAAGRNVTMLRDQINEFRPCVVSVMDAEPADALDRLLDGAPFRPQILHGEEGYRCVAAHPDAHVVVSAMVGAAGLLPTLAAIEAGKTLALANKETLVVAGEIVMSLAARKGVAILPVDSEHSAIFQCLQGNHRSALRRILLTASGGPFFRCGSDELCRVTPEAALRHPNWSMGRKITIDSATLMNKGLEVIEATWLFGAPVDQISVHIHPESIIHSMVEYIDGSVIAQLGIPDMKLPIAYALSYPERLPVEAPPLDLFGVGKLSFFQPDEDRFPCLRLAYEACRKGATFPAVLNAANEVAVSAFLEGRIGFMQIPRLIGSVMSTHHTVAETLTLEAVLEADRQAREEAERMAAELALERQA